MNLPEDSEALAAAMLQILSDMGLTALCVCPTTKAQARLAYEPFAEENEKADIMPLEEAQRILRELEN